MIATPYDSYGIDDLTAIRDARRRELTHRAADLGFDVAALWATDPARALALLNDLMTLAVRNGDAQVALRAITAGFAHHKQDDERPTRYEL